MFRKTPIRSASKALQNTSGKLTHLPSINFISNKHITSIDAVQKNTANTTGWTTNTVHQFEIGALITLLRLDYIGYARSNITGPTELAFHFLDEGRELSQTYINRDGTINNFDLHILPRMKVAQPLLKRIYSEVNEYADSLSMRDLKTIFKSEETIEQLVQEIEAKFGQFVFVTPYGFHPETRNALINNARDAIFNRDVIMAKEEAGMTSLNINHMSAPII